MRRHISVILIALALFSVGLNAQTRSLITVSPLIGDTLDVDEESVLHLFPNASGFKWAVFYLKASGIIEAEVFLQSDDGSKIRVMNVGRLKFLQERIVSRSDQAMRDKAAQESSVRRVQASTTGETQRKPQKQKLGEQRKDESGYAQALTSFVGEEISNVELKKASSDFLPLAANTLDIDFRSYPALSGGAGITWFSPDFGGLTAAYKAIEDFYRNQGYNVPQHEAKANLGHLYSYSLEVGISPEYSAVVEAATTSGDDAVLKMISLFGLYRPEKSERFPLSWYLGLGITRQYFKVVERYGNLISPSQNYKYLDDIISEGAGIGYILEAGIDIRLKSTASIKASFRYLYAQDIIAATSDGQTAKINLSAPMAGVQVMFYF